jgi:site-specific DNA recombinase
MPPPSFLQVTARKVTVMSSRHGNGKPLRFASLIRVSTKEQEQEGESLRTQKNANERDVQRLGGRIIDTYGGQEHATPGYAKKEIDRLLADAAKGRFDAVIVAYADRWSRDNAKSKEGLQRLRDHSVRFYVGATEYNLHDPQHRFMLGMFAETGEFVALLGAKKSIEVRIERARRGIPTCGKMPYGRTFDPETETWGIDTGKQALIADIAERLIKGESLNSLATEYGSHKGRGLAHSNLSKVLRHQCGDRWSYTLKSARLNIRETITIKVPPLLSPATIKAACQRLEANRTYVRSGGRRIHDYLLSGFIFCAKCGYGLTGQVTHTNRAKADRYYRHGHCNGAKDCAIRPRPWVPADRIEKAVLRDLFQMVGNPAAIERAVKAAVPDSDKAARDHKRLSADLAKIEKAKGNLIEAIADGIISNDDARKKREDLREREDALRRQLDKLDETLAAIPDEASVRCYV